MAVLKAAVILNIMTLIKVMKVRSSVDQRGSIQTQYTWVAPLFAASSQLTSAQFLDAVCADGAQIYMNEDKWEFAFCLNMPL